MSSNTDSLLPRGKGHNIPNARYYGKLSPRKDISTTKDDSYQDEEKMDESKYNTLILINEEPKYSKVKVSHRLAKSIVWIRDSEFLKSDDWWSVYIGFLIFALIVPLILKLHMTMPIFTGWKDNPLMSFDGNTIMKLLVFQYVTVALLGFGFKCMGKSGVNAGFVTGFSFVFWLAVLAKIVGQNIMLKRGGLGDSVWAILIGAFITNTFYFTRDSLPNWLKSVVVTEFYIKISVVLLVVDLSLFKMIGLQGLITTWIDTPIVLLIMFISGIFIFRLSRDEAIILAGGTTICGSSAATAISSAVNADKSIAPLVIAIMSFFTVPLIPTMPLFAAAVKIKPRVAGAWIGGSVDSTGAVIATAAPLGAVALETAAIVKMMQNIIIGPVCLILTVLWTRKFHPKVLYDRFPKFVLGFLILSGILSTAIPIHLRAVAQKNVFIVSEWFSTFGFICIGLELNMRKLVGDLKKNGWRFIVLYVIGQTIDILSTFGWAYLSFTYINIHKKK
jgi:uncharacterized membrane protein YadS